VGDAPAGSFSGQDVIRFAVGMGGTVSMAGRELTVLGDLSIEGPGSELLTFNPGGENRVFSIRPCASASLSGMTIVGGSADYGGAIRNHGSLALTEMTLHENSASEYGGALHSAGLLNMHDCLITGNSAKYGGGVHVAGIGSISQSAISDNAAVGEYGTGGGIHQWGGVLTVTDSTISGNTATDRGGGIRTWGSAFVNRSTISGNTAGDDGGGIFCTSDLSMSDSTISDNVVMGSYSRGGGLYCHESTVTANNCTFAANSANYQGGAIDSSACDVVLTGCTFRSNSAKDCGGAIHNGFTFRTIITDSSFFDNFTTDEGSCGGAIYSRDAATITGCTLLGNSTLGYGGGIAANDVTIVNSTLTDNSARIGGGLQCGSNTSISNSIIAGNWGSESRPDVNLGSNVSGAHNLIGDGSEQTAFVDGVDGNQVGTADEPIDPRLSDWTQADNGRWGCYLLPGSPALDAGSNELAVTPTGWPLVKDAFGNARIQDGTVDIGAVEGAAAGTPSVTYLVTSLQNTVASDGVLTFFEALEAANRNQPVGDALPGSFVEQDVIQFASGLSGTISVEHGQLVILGDLVIEGPDAGQLVFDAGGHNRVFDVLGQAEVVLCDLTVTGGAAACGGGIYNRGSLTVSHAVISGNTATDGGAILNQFGELVMDDSIISDNTASGAGGGIKNDRGAVELAECVLSNNAADGSGGGIHNDLGAVAVLNSTISNNGAGGDGGGMANVQGELTVLDCMLLDNSAGADGGGVASNDGEVAIGDSTLMGNVSGSNGGAIAASQGRVTVSNSSIVNNSTLYDGGAICSRYGLLGVRNATISGNTTANQAFSEGGGLFILESAATLNNTIVSGNYAPTSVDLFVHESEPSGWNNLIGDGSGQTSLVDGVNGNQVGTTLFPIDPLFGDLTEFENGHWCFYLLPGSPAINAGFNFVATDIFSQPLATDLQGASRILYGTVDIGACEFAISVDAGGSYRGDEGAAITLVATATTGPDGTTPLEQDAVLYEWDFDGDGHYDDATGGAVEFSTCEDGVYVVRVRVTDPGGPWAEDSAVVTVRNVAPTADAGGPYVVEEGQTVTLTASDSTDPGHDIVLYEWDLDGDGEYDDGAGEMIVYKASAVGEFTVAVRVSDDDGESDTDTAEVRVKAVQTAIPGDANHDNAVDETDAAILANHWGMSNVDWEDGDFNDDDVVNIMDAAILAANWKPKTTLPEEREDAAPFVGPLPESTPSDGRQLLRPANRREAAESAPPARPALSPVGEAAACDIVLSEMKEYGPQPDMNGSWGRRLIWANTLSRRKA
jgi:predicted outer membrane repeat protein